MSFAAISIVLGQANVFAQTAQTNTLNGLNPAIATPPTLSNLETLPTITTVDSTPQSTAQTTTQQTIAPTPVPTPFPNIPNQPPGAGQIQTAPNPPQGVDQARVGSVTQIQGGALGPQTPIGPFDPTGIQRGRFILRPALEVAGGYTTNSTNDVTGGSSTFQTVSPSLGVESNFARHALNFQFGGAFSSFQSGSDTRDINFEATTTGRYDIDSQTSVTAISQVIVAEDDITGVADDPLESNFLGALQLDSQVNGFDTRALISLARTENGSFIDAAGLSVDQDDLNSLVFTGNLRGTLNRGAAFEPFIEVEAEREIFDEEFDEFGNERNVTGLRGQLGFEIDRGDKLNGEISFGYGQNFVDGSGIADFGGFIANINLNWSPERLTNIVLGATTAFDNFPTVGTPGDITYDFNFALTRDIRENLQLNAGSGLVFQVDGLTEEIDTTVEANIGVAYSINRNLALGADYNFIRQFTSDGFGDFTTNSVSLNLRAER